MGHIYESATELIGHTPIVDFSALVKAAGVEGKLLCKDGVLQPNR